MNIALILVASAFVADAPFGSFEIAETQFRDRDFAITDFDARRGFGIIHNNTRRQSR